MTGPVEAPETASADDSALPRPERRTFRTRMGPRLRGMLSGGTLLAVGILLVVWEISARVFDMPFLPTIFGVADRLVELLQDGAVRTDILTSLRNLAFGFGIAAVVGVTVGLLMGQIRIVRYALEPYVNAMLMAPQLVFAPILFIIFGLSSGAIITLIVLYATFIIVVNTMAGLHSVDRALTDMAVMYGATRFQVARRVALPAATPMIMAGIRLGMGRAVKGMINGEMFIAFVGLGARAITFGGRFDAEGVVAIVVIVVIISLIATGIVQLIDNRATAWCKDARA
jgi:NitT/TauT family transport system permease protein